MHNEYIELQLYSAGKRREMYAPNRMNLVQDHVFYKRNTTGIFL
jgi:hypothetical protein